MEEGRAKAAMPTEQVQGLKVEHSDNDINYLAMER
jgi:hypothetical protein